MTVRATEILKAIQKLNPAEKHRLREYLIDALTASSSTGTVLHEISEHENKNGYECPECESEHIVRFGKYPTIVDGEEVKKQPIAVKFVKRHLLTSQIQFYIELVTLLTGLNLLSVYRRVLPSYVRRFYWRHKLLSSLKQIKIPNFEGILEMDETYFLYSEKGQRKIKDANIVIQQKSVV